VPSCAENAPRGAVSTTNFTSSANLFTSIESLDNLHRLAPGDRVSYRVTEDKEDAKSLVVTDSGELDVPYLGRVRAADKTCQALAREIKTALEKDLYYRATVILAIDQLNRKRGIVYLAGQIRVPGPVEIPSDEVCTLSRALLRAGGFADCADQKRVKITRGSAAPGASQVFIVNVREILEKGRPGNDPVLEPGDLVFVPSRLFNF
jgi:polysaccharide export outer membrane protein